MASFFGEEVNNAVERLIGVSLNHLCMLQCKLWQHTAALKSARAMFNQGTAPAAGAAKGAALASVARSDALHKVVAGTEIDLGVVSAETIRAQHPKPDAESSMHGGIPAGNAYYHVNISLFDA